MANHAHEFTDVDAAADPALFVDLMTRAAAIDGIQVVRRRAIEHLILSPGARILDVGCGPGDSTAEIAAGLVPGGEAVGVDYSEAMITAADRRHGAGGLPLTFAVGDARNLAPFAEDEFDGCRTERMLCHLPNEEPALAEMLRVTRRGGRVVVIDTDFDLVVVDGVNPGLCRRIVQSLADSAANPHIGRRLGRTLRAVGLSDVTVEEHVVTLPIYMSRYLFDAHMQTMEAARTLTGDERASFWRALEAADDAGDFYAAFVVFLGAGTVA